MRLFVVVVVVYLVVVTLVPDAVGNFVALMLFLYGLPLGLALVLCLTVLPLRLGLAAPLLGLPAVVVFLLVVARLVGLLFDAVVDP